MAPIISEKGFIKSLGLAVLLVLIIIFTIGYFLFQKTPNLESKILLSQIFTDQNQLDEKSLDKRLNNFPLYPSAAFIKNEKSTGCILEKEGKKLCALEIFAFKTSDDIKKVKEWYFRNHGKAGWHCDMGADSLENNLILNEKQCSNEKLNLTYILRTESELTSGTSLFILTP